MKRSLRSRTVTSSLSPSVYFAERTAKVDELQATLDLGKLLNEEERDLFRRAIELTPDAQVEAVADLAARNGGVLFGVAFDPSAARTAIEYAVAARNFARALRLLARRVDDTAIARRKEVSVRARAAIGAMQSTARLPGEDAAATMAAAVASLRPRRPAKKGQAKGAKAKGKAADKAPQTPAAEPKPQAPAKEGEAVG